MKVKYGLKNCYYALATIAADGTATYGAPKRLPGAVALTMDPAGEKTNFYADDSIYFSVGGANGYTGSLEIAMIPDSFREECLGEIKQDGVYIETGVGSSQAFALLFEFQSDENEIKHVLYNVTASRPSIAGNTKGETVEVKTDTLNLTAATIHNAALDKDITKARVADKTAAAFSTWYTSVYQPLVSA
ncbi:phage major tail protein, phi13 family [Butyrivibrio sp. INlla18]|uniref:major tail protein n=1 Tax=Butyrivibrio sp. INlla18 TaxID=1520806 RepID=UPI00088A6829|nr:major tail protein [Butyrivibrio sp. INlla18]SDA71184.1 phage major tail protein, phi13 family [Butyrivibrio sp. INlla18]